MEGILGQCECKGNVYVQAGVYVCALCESEVELHCGACGRACKLRNGAFPKFCSICQAPFRARITKIKCSSCGGYTELGDDDRFCPDCSEPLPVPHLWRSASDLSSSLNSQSKWLSESSSSSLDPNPGQGSVSANVADSSASVAVPAQNVPSSSGVDRGSTAASSGATGYDSERADSRQESSHANSSGNTSFEVIHRSQSFPESSDAAADVRTMHDSLSLPLVHEESVGNRDPDLVDTVVIQSERVPATSAACQDTVPHKVSCQENGHANSSENTSFEVIHRSQSFPGSSDAAADVRTMHESLSLPLVHEESVGNRDPDLVDTVVIQSERVPATSAACQDTVPYKDLDIVSAADSSDSSQDHTLLLANDRVTSAESVADDGSMHSGPHSNREVSRLAVLQESEDANTLRRFISRGNDKTLSGRPQRKRASVLLVQCAVAHSCTELIACARHIVNRECNEVMDAASVVPWKYYVMFLLQVSRGTSISGLHGGLWRCVHIDDLRRPSASQPQLHSSESHSIGGLLDSPIRSDAEVFHEIGAADARPFDEDGSAHATASHDELSSAR